MTYKENGWPEWLTTWDHLGSHYPYHQDGQHHFHMKISSAIEEMPVEQRKIDPVAVVEFLSKSYCLGNRTLVWDLRRSPWIARPDRYNGWQYAKYLSMKMRSFQPMM